MSVVAAAIAGSAVAGLAGAAMSSSAAKDAAQSGADATVLSTQMQIEAAEKARRRAVRASREANELATIYTTKGAVRSKRALMQAAGENQQALLGANRDTMGALVEGEQDARGAEIAGARDARNATVNAEQEARGAEIAGARGARNASVAANLRNNDLFREAFQDSAGQLKDWRVAGRQAINTVSKGLEDGSFTMDKWKFEADPGYQFRLQEGEQALNRSAAAGGNLLSGDQLTALQQYGQNFASNEYDKAYTREAADRQRQYDQLMGVADRGQKATNDTAALRSEMATNVGQGNLNIGAARAGFSLARGASEATAARNIGEARSNYFDTRADSESDAARAIAAARADAATRKGNILGSTALSRGGILSDMHTTIAGAKSQAELNIANTVAGAAANEGAATAGAYQNQGNQLAQIYSNQGQQQQAAIGAGVQAIDSGLSNYLTYNMLQRSGLLGATG